MGSATAADPVLGDSAGHWLIAMLVWPKFLPVPFLPQGLDEATVELFPRIAGLIQLIGGSAIGWLVGLMIHQILLRSTGFRAARNSEGIPIAMMLIGGFLGWQACLGIAAITLLFACIIELWAAGARVPVLPWFGLTSVAAAAHHVFWRWLNSLGGWWPGQISSWLQCLGFAIILFCSWGTLAILMKVDHNPDENQPLAPNNE